MLLSKLKTGKIMANKIKPGNISKKLFSVFPQILEFNDVFGKKKARAKIKKMKKISKSPSKIGKLQSQYRLSTSKSLSVEQYPINENLLFKKKYVITKPQGKIQK